MVAFQIGCDVRTFAVELVSRLLDYLCTRFSGSGAVLVDSPRDTHMHALGVPASERGRTASPVRPLVTDHDDTVLVGHLGMHDIALDIRQDLTRLETEGGLQPLERGAAVLVCEGRDQGGSARCRRGHGALP